MFERERTLKPFSDIYFTPGSTVGREEAPSRREKLPKPITTVSECCNPLLNSLPEPTVRSFWEHVLKLKEKGGRGRKRRRGPRISERGKHIIKGEIGNNRHGRRRGFFGEPQNENGKICCSFFLSLPYRKKRHRVICLQRRKPVFRELQSRA